MIATDYTDYAIVYECSTDWSLAYALDGKQAQINVYTRDGS